jgi:spectinomycin phosphotransferase
VHAAALPPELARRIPVEDYSARWREITLDFDAQVDASALEGEPVSARLSALWREKRAIILDLVERSDALARLMALRDMPCVLCHTDLHAGNVLLGAQGDLAIVDWDAPLLAPKERDLMFIGGGIGGVWTEPAESAAFYRGYGPTEIDALAMAYYRIERIVVDIAEYGMQIFGVQGSIEDREVGLERLIGLFNPNPVLESANQSYRDYQRGA